MAKFRLIALPCWPGMHFLLHTGDLHFSYDKIRFETDHHRLRVKKRVAKVATEPFYLQQKAKSHSVEMAGLRFAKLSLLYLQLSCAIADFFICLLHVHCCSHLVCVMFRVELKVSAPPRMFRFS